MLLPRVLSLADVSMCDAPFGPLAGVAEVIERSQDEVDLRAGISDFDALLLNLKVKIERDVLETAEKLKVIATVSTGRDHIDLEYARDRGIRVISLEENSPVLLRCTATAELGFALLLAVVRKLPWAFNSAFAGRWARDEFRGHQLSGKTLGILGYGRLGRMMAEYGKGFRMKVLACDHKSFHEPGVTRVDFSTLLRESDVLSLHVRLEGNEDFLSEAAIANMKPGAILINTSRGGLVDEGALLDALQSGHLAGAGLDVIYGEWRSDLKNHPLIQYANSNQNLVISPHIGGATFESQQYATEFIIAQLADYLRTRFHPESCTKNKL